MRSLAAVVTTTPEEARTAPRPSTLVFDGACGFCTRVARWIQRRAGDEKVRLVCWQRADLRSYGLTESEAREAVWWIDPSGRRFRAERAVGKALEEGTGWSSLVGSAILTSPFVWLAAPVYRAVARFRGHLPGVTPACPEKGDATGNRNR